MWPTGSQRHSAISIHALLAESDSTACCRSILCTISIHALLAESDNRDIANSEREKNISIHALLAESDVMPEEDMILEEHFYPRSPCGERPYLAENQSEPQNISIHALLAESD